MVVGGPYLGACVDAEADGQPAANAVGDDLGAGSTVFGVCGLPNDDEDGVAFAGALSPGDPNAPVSVTASGAAILNAWIDFNGDGDWDEANEQIFSDQALAAGINALSFSVPPSASAGITYARFRLNGAGGLSFVGLASDGEVEDHRLEVLPGGKVPSLGPRGLGALTLALLGAGAAATSLGVRTRRRRAGA